MLRRVTLVRTDVWEELYASFNRVTRIGEIGTTLAVTNIVPSSPILVTLMKGELRSSETSVLTRATRCNIQKTPLFMVNVVPSSPIPVTLMMEALRSSETSVLASATRRIISEDGILRSHRRGNLKSYRNAFIDTEKKFRI
jgi:hypothetical protein